MGYILLNIDKEGTPSTHLGPKMGMESRSLTRSLKAMEENGLIVRKPDRNDKRKVLVMLTEEGRRMRDISRDVVIRFNEKMHREIGIERLEETFETLQKISQVIDDKEIFESN